MKNLSEKRALLEKHGWSLVWMTTFHGFRYYGYRKGDRCLEATDFRSAVYAVK
jgi:hypothetical protein